MKYRRTWRGLAVAVAAVLSFGIAPTFASADDPVAGDTAWSEAISAEGPSADDLAAEGQDAGGIAPRAAAAPTPDIVWDFFRLVNTRRINQGGSPWVMNSTLNGVSNTWLAGQSGFPSTDPNFDQKVPGSFSVAWHTTAWAVATSATDAVQALARTVNTADLSWTGTTDIGIGMTERPYSGSYKLYSFSMVAVDYPHSAAQSGEMTLYRFYRPNTGTHFYSTTAAERNTVAKNSAYRYEGQVAYVLTPNSTQANARALNRFYQPASGTHFYTSTTAEYNRVRAMSNYSLDGVAAKVFTAPATNQVPMYRFFKPASGTHFYTANASEAEQVKQMAGYQYEGVAFYLRRAS